MAAPEGNVDSQLAQLAPKRSKHVAHPQDNRLALRPLQPRTALVEQVIERIQEGVFCGEFPVGSELPAEGKLAKTFGVSYTVVREAMRVLRSYGLVEISQGRRPRVKPAGSGAVRETLDAMFRRADSSIRKLTEFRRPLECEIAALAAGRATSVEIDRMEQAITRQAAAETLEQQIEADMEFHDLLATAAGNELFNLVLSSVRGLLWKSRQQTISQVGSEHALASHRAVLEAVRCRDARVAREKMLEHIDNVLEDLEEK